MSIQKTTILQQQKNVFFNKVDGDLVMLDIEKGKYFSTNPLGSIIWEKLSTPLSFGDLIEQLLNEYDVDRLVCEADTLAFLVRAIDLGFVTSED